MVKKNPSIEEIIDYYYKKNILIITDNNKENNKRKITITKNEIKELSEKIKPIDKRIPFNIIKRNLEDILVWPSIEIYRIITQSKEKISNTEKENIEKLIIKQKNIFRSNDYELINKFLEKKQSYITFLNPYKTKKENFISTILSMRDCDLLIDHANKTTKGKTNFFLDAKLGGSLYLIGNDKNIEKINNVSYSFLERIFTCKNYDDEKILFVDSIEAGEPYFSRIDHWRGFNEELKKKIRANRVHYLYIALAGTIYLADELGIKKIVLRDNEMNELGKIIGVKEEKVFDKNIEKKYWKIGLRADKKNFGVYAHSLYTGSSRNKGTQIRYRVLNVPKLKSPDYLFDEFNNKTNYIHNINENRTRNIAPGSKRELEKLISLYNLIMLHPGLKDEKEKKEKTKSSLNKLLNKLEKINNDLKSKIIIYDKLKVLEEYYDK